MNRETALYLNALNKSFYACVHESFSATRNNSWPGWSRALPYIHALSSESGEPLQVLDLACGNMRFEKYLNLDASLTYEVCCVDNCELMADLDVSCRYIECDIVASLLNRDGSLERGILAPKTFDLVACFGFFHHIPGFESRQLLLSMILEALKPGGIALMSLWRFMDNEKLSAKAVQAHESFSQCLSGEGLQLDQLEDGDYFLAWQDRKDVCRYCHHFSDGEIDRLIDGVKSQAEILDRYRKDGRDHRSNEYLVLRRK